MTTRSRLRAASFLMAGLLCLQAGCATVLERVTGRGDGPGAISARYEESVRAYAEGDFEAAAAGFEEIVTHVPANAEAWYRLGNSYGRIDRPRDAATAYEQAVVRDPQHARAWYNLSIVRTRMAANSFLEMSRSLPPGDPLREIALEMADALLDSLEGPARGRFEEAVRDVSSDHTPTDNISPENALPETGAAVAPAEPSAVSKDVQGEEASP